MNSGRPNDATSRAELASMTWREAETGPRTMLVPLGSTEQHGPHLPLATDTIIATVWCRRVAATRRDCAVAPALPYGSSGEHQAFTGTLSIGSDALVTVLVELGRSALPPFERLVFVNGHGGNTPALRTAVELLRSEGRRCDAVLPRLAGDAHAGHIETSLLLAEVPHLVSMDRVEQGNTTPLPDLLPALIRDGVRAHSPNGVLGDPRSADPEVGERLWNQLVDQLNAVLDET